MKKVLVLFSGGKDSMLSAMLLAEKGYQVFLIHYDNSFEIGISNIKNGVKRLEEKYGKDRIKYIGVKKIDALFRELIREFYNFKTNIITQNFGNISISQFNCLACRLSMYLTSIIICKQLDIDFVADGAPVKNLEDDFQEKNEFLIRGIIPKVSEPQCLLGIPYNSEVVEEEMISAVVKTYKNHLFPKIDILIKKYSNIKMVEKYI